MANEYLKRTPTSTGNRKVFTWSGWVKRNQISSDSFIFSAGSQANNWGGIHLNATRGVGLLNVVSGSVPLQVQTIEARRDASSWFNVVVSVDTTKENSQDRVRMYVDGVNLTEFQTHNTVQNDNTWVNSLTMHGVGRLYDGANPFATESEMFDLFFVDGQALTPDVFGFNKDGDGYVSVGSTQATDFRPGQWSPHSPRKIKTEIERKGGFGVNGFYLPMNDSSNFGADFHCTPNSIIKLKGEDLPQPRNGAPTTSDAYVSELRQETGTLGFDGAVIFDGNGDTLEFANSNDFEIGSSNFCMEAFIFVKKLKDAGIFGNNQSSGSPAPYAGYEFDLRSDGALDFYSGNGSAYNPSNLGAQGPAGVIKTGRWYHIAAVRNGNNFRIYVDGNKVAENTSFSHTVANTNTVFRLGSDGVSTGTSWNFDGLISNARLVKGSPVYTSNFTPPTEPLTAITNTKLLCCNSSTSATASTVTPGSITANGNASATRNELTGSIVLAVPGISTATGSNLITNGSFDSDFSGWTNGNPSQYTYTYNSVGEDTSGKVMYYAVDNNLRTFYQYITCVSGKRYTLSFDACSDTANAMVIDIDGTNVVTIDDNNNVGYIHYNVSFTAGSTSVRIRIESQLANRSYFDNFVVKQEDAPKDYSADIKGSGTNRTPTVSGPIGVGYNIPSHYGSAINTTNTGDPLYYNVDGSGSNAYGTDDFTFECWFYATKEPSTWGILMKHATNGTWHNGITLSSKRNTTRVFTIYTHDGTSAFETIGTTTWELNQWHHVVAERYNGQLTLYLNGVAENTRADTRNYAIAGTPASSAQYALTIGGQSNSSFQSNGYIQDVRVYKGVAKYKGGFDVTKPYTPVGIESWRQVSDTCKNNFCTMNPLNHNNGTFANGNLTTSEPAANGAQIYATMGSNTGKWYYEAHIEDVGTPNTAGTLIGINPLIRPSSNHQNRTAYRSNGDIYNDSSGNSGSSSYAYVAGDTIGVAWDADNKRLWFAKNGTWLGSGDPAGNSNSNVNYTNTETQGPFIAYDNGTGAQVTHLNFGQNPSFSGQITAGTYTDGNGKGLFKYQPPTGFLALCEDNLPTPAIVDPGKHFKTVLWTGDGNGGRSVPGVGFAPNLVWVKRRDGAAVRHYLFDSIRGPHAALDSADTIAEVSSSTWLQSFDSNGFSLGTSGGLNGSGNNYVAWCWKAGGPAVPNTDGTLNAQVSVNQDAGFSIVNYTGNGINLATVGHGLNKAPSFIISKNRASNASWPVYHKDGSNSGNSATDVVYLNLDNVGNSNNYRNVNDTTFGITNWAGINEVNQNHIAYCWTEIEGFSKFGSYEGNAAADGPFVYCGFKPAVVIIKWADGTASWVIHDSSRTSTNPSTLALLPNSSGAELDASTLSVDFLSNGFKIRNTNASYNNASTYIFAAWAESPFQTANAK
jgi:hypothetical protein